MKAIHAAETAETFRNPPSQYRGAPFWSWNGRLEPEELCRQIRQMKDAGMGGFFMHARVGLNTPYLGEEWFHCVKTCVAEAEKLGMKAYLYDEDRWPSGAAGGLVTGNDEFRARQLHLVEFENPADCAITGDTLALFQAEADGIRISKVRRLSAVPAALAPGEKLLRINREIQPTNPWYNDTSYLDVLNADAVAKFIEVTHEAYARKLGEKFGDSVPAIFTDEPNFGAVNAVQPDGSRISAWTDRFPEIFRDRFGYDLIDRLPEIFYIVEGREHSQTALHYMECLTTLFVDNFAKQIGEWCGAHNIAFTGHVLCEDTLESQSALVGNCMRFYEYMQIPGMDQLTEYWQIFDTVKQLSSAARQFDRPWRLSETYGCTGWHFPFAGHKAIGDWQSVLGVNIRCQHLAWYTMQGEAKRDYPAAISRQSPWFRYYHVIEDYFARVNTVFSEGREVRDILLVHPLESMWMLMGGRNATWVMGKSDGSEIEWLDRGFVNTRTTLLEHQLDFDFGDEELMARHASVDTTGAAPIFRIGAAEYRAVVLPPMLTMRSSTFELLKRFHAAGGRIFAIDADRLACCRDGAKDASLSAELRAMVEGDSLAKLDAEFRRLRISDPAGAAPQAVLYQLRERDDGLALMLCNTGFPTSVIDPAPGQHAMFNYTRVLDRTRSYPDLTVRIDSAAEGEWFEFEAETGKIYAVKARRENNQWVFDSSLAALQSRIYLLAPAGTLTAEPRPEYVTVQSEKLAPRQWELQLEEPNVVVCDVARYRLDGGEWQAPTLITQIDDKIRTAAGALPRGGAMVQPWARKPLNLPPTEVELEFCFGCEQTPTAPVRWAMEHPEEGEVKINGVKLSPVPVGFWMDECLKTLAVPAGVLRRGANRVEVKIRYDQNCDGLESMFLLGAFGVRMEGVESVLTALPTALTPGDWCLQGLPNYSGNAAYTTQVNIPSTKLAPVLRAERFGGAALRILVNGEEAGFILAPPYELNLEGLAKPGLNTLSIEVLGTRRNSHGPFYCGDLYPEWTDSGMLKGYEREERLLVPAGLLDAPTLILKRKVN